MSNWKLKLLYDGECPFCMKEIRWLSRWNQKGNLVFEDITLPDFNPAKYGLTQEEVIGVMHGVYPDGRIVTRVDAFREAYRLIGLGWLLAPTGWPILRGLFNWFYTLFARNRVRLGRFFGRSCDTGRCDIHILNPKRKGK